MDKAAISNLTSPELLTRALVNQALKSGLDAHDMLAASVNCVIGLIDRQANGDSRKFLSLVQGVNYALVTATGHLFDDQLRAAQPKRGRPRKKDLPGED